MPFLARYLKPGFHPWETDERRDLLERFKADLEAVAAADTGPDQAANAA